jgi:hypothetical protein
MAGMLDIRISHALLGIGIDRTKEGDSIHRSSCTKNQLEIVFQLPEHHFNFLGDLLSLNIKYLTTLQEYLLELRNAGYGFYFLPKV